MTTKLEKASFVVLDVGLRYQDRSEQGSSLTNCKIKTATEVAAWEVQVVFFLLVISTGIYRPLF